MRTFETKSAKREQVPLFIGLMGPSSSGKTFSALRLATGIQRVAGGAIHLIDTEARRALHYADRFKFEHTPFEAPFSPADYLAVTNHCLTQGGRIIVVDSMSHEHESIGGVLEMHEREVQRLSGGDAKKAERVKMLAWSKPKQERRRMLNSFLQMPAHFIFCFRAKPKLKIMPGKEPEHLGLMPIAGEEMLFEMTVNCLLYPQSGGVPTWRSDEIGERMMMKLPEQFREVFSDSNPLDEDIGQKLAVWAAGGAVNRHGELTAAIRLAADPAALEQLVPLLEEAKKGRTVSPGEYQALRAAYKARKDELAAVPPHDPATGELFDQPTRQPGEEG